MSKISLLAIGLSLLAGTALAQSPAQLDEFLRDGRVDEAIEAYASPDSDAERFSLGLLQLLNGVREFTTGINRLGPRADSALNELPFMPRIRANPDLATAEAVTPKMLAALFKDLRTSMRRANATLAEIGDDDFGVELDLNQIRIDFDGDGTASDSETLAIAGARLLGQRGVPEPDISLPIRFDSADAVWLQGYTHFLTGVLEIVLAHEWRPVWDQIAHLLFVNPDPPPEFTRWADSARGFERWIDFIAAVHEMRLDVVDKKAWPRAIEEFRGMFDSSRRCWARVLEESDNEHEWLPSPTQTGPAGATITQEQIDGWLRVLDELDAVATGEKLLPHGRVKAGAGINLAKLADSPPALDLVMWIHGAAFLPYLEEGPVSDSATWNGLTAPFGTEFGRFAIWSN